jgi:uncharacterized protein YjbI with pentapeptide repeats
VLLAASLAVALPQSAFAELNKLEAAAGGEFGNGTALQFGEADIKGKDFSNQDLRRSNFTSADCRDCNFKVHMHVHLWCRSRAHVRACVCW